jgi:hypothetical protein
MSFKAVWPIYDPTDLRAGEQAVVNSPDAVDAFVVNLSRDNAGAAMIQHQSRPLEDDSLGLMGPPGTGKIPDHDVTAGVWKGFGYLSYTDPENEYSMLAGDDKSPMYASDYVEYPAGSGVPVEILAAALKEFLVTAKRPTCVEWRNLS